MTTPSDTATASSPTRPPDADGTDSPDTGRPEPGSHDGGAGGAGDDAGSADATPPRARRPWHRLRWVPLVLVVVAALLAAGAGIRGLVDRPPSDASVDAGFARDMSTHHAQAVTMAMTELQRGGDGDVRAVARDIALAQQREIGVMSTWLTSWGLSQSSSHPPMAWMRELPGGSGHAHDGGATAENPTMPGLATQAEITELTSSSGRAADVLFLQLMVRHHRGGITMAQEAALTADDPDVRALARAMVVNQSAEIDVMQADLRRLGAPPA